MNRRLILVASSILAVLLLASTPATARRWFEKRLEIPEGLARDYREWLETVSLLMNEVEFEYFLSLEEDFRRYAFMERFWEVRDPEPRTPHNELKRKWLGRVSEAIHEFGSLDDARARFYMMNGEPGRFVIGNGMVLSVCYSPRTELEIWFYGGSEQTNQRFAVFFFRPVFRSNWGYRAWLKDGPLDADVRKQLPSENPMDFCQDDWRNGAFRMIVEDPFYENFLDGLMEVPKVDSKEWIETFEAQTTDLPDDVETFDVELDLEFPGRNQSRTAVQGLVRVPAAAVAPREVEGSSHHEFLLVGEVIRGNRLFETFRYHFETPADASAQTIPLIFQRYLRAGEAEIRLRVEDIYGRRFAHTRQVIDVPSAEGLSSIRQASDLPVFALLEEANAAAERGQTTIRLVPPTDGEIQLGQVRFTTVVGGDVDKVTFLVNDRPIMTKREPPYSLELNLGSVAARHRVGVVAYDAAGDERARDELLVNQGGQRFRVRLVEPRTDRTYLDSLSAIVQVETPEGASLERVELYLDEEKIATLYQEPFVQAILLRQPGMAYVRAVGYLEDGNSTEDVVFVNAPDYFEEVEVQLVELFATVVSNRGEPLLDLDTSDFTVIEDGVEQEIRRFEYVRNLPIHATLLVDTSASMTEGLTQVTDAARSFAEQTIEERDRLALVSFNIRPRLEVKFTNSQQEISAALDGLRAAGSTALYDSLIYALHYFDGVKGQKALLLLSDGVDEASRFAFENALETARRAGVTVYVIGMKELAEDRDARRTLRDLAKVTGGRAFFIDDLADLPQIYEQIQQELRSQYLLVYQSTSDKDEAEFRRVEVKVKDADVRTVAGYYP